MGKLQVGNFSPAKNFLELLLQAGDWSEEQRCGATYPCLEEIPEVEIVDGEVAFGGLEQGCDEAQGD